MIILAIGAHPDDLEISCAGALVKMHQAGHRIVMCHASDGDKGHYQMKPEELIRIRRQEAQHAADVLGCEAVSLRLRDGEISETDQAVKSSLASLIRRIAPDIVITHAPNDYMPDHNALSRLVFDTTFLATLPAYPAEGPPAPKVPALFYMDNLSGAGFTPGLYVDITDTFETKLEMLRCHQSQLTWLKEHDDIDIIDFVTTSAKSRGIQAGCRYSEGFIHHMVWGRQNTLRFPV